MTWKRRSNKKALEPDIAGVIFFQKNLLKWFRKNGRKYPWRLETDPFKILIAEIMLQRTKADQVLPVYTESIQKWQNAKSLLETNTDDIAAIFSRLGLSWRSKLVAHMARCIQSEYEGKIPAIIRSLLKSANDAYDWVS